jgi:hypothetical protein
LAHTNTTNINSMWNDFKSGCLDNMNRYIPTKLTSTRYSQPWINREIKQLKVLVRIDLVEMDGW